MKRRGKTVSIVATATYGAFAECINRSGAVLYSASWCPHCQKQLQGFRGCQSPQLGRMRPSRHEFLARRCEDKRIRGFPTWILGDGTVRAKYLGDDELAKLTGCAKP